MRWINSAASNCQLFRLGRYFHRYKSFDVPSVTCINILSITENTNKPREFCCSRRHDPFCNYIVCCFNFKRGHGFSLSSRRVDSAQEGTVGGLGPGWSFLLRFATPVIQNHDVSGRGKMRGKRKGNERQGAKKALKKKRTSFPILVTSLVTFSHLVHINALPVTLSCCGYLFVVQRWQRPSVQR